jgi:hypothetical protein
MIIDPSSQQEFSDADFRIVDSADQSKKLRFDPSGITTATTRTWTVPDSDVTVSAYVAEALDDTSVSQFLATIGVRYAVGNIADDAVASVVLPAGTYVGMLTSTLNNTASMFLFRSNSGAVPFSMAPSSGGTVIDYSNATLTGTTGTDGRITLSVGPSGTTFYVENRRGTAMNGTILHVFGPA